MFLLRNLPWILKRFIVINSRFVLYQLSKNLNRPFFMDFLTHLSVRYAHGHVCDEEDPDDEDGPLLDQMTSFLKPTNKVLYMIFSLKQD